MKPIFPLLLAFLLGLCINTDAQAQTKTATKPAAKPTAAAATESTDENIVFRIKIGAFKSPDTKKFEALTPPKGSVLTEDAGNGLTRVLIGDYKTEADANKALENVKKAGYPDAFVTKRKLDAKTTPTKPATASKDKEETKPTATDAKPADTDKYFIQLGLIKEPDFTNYGNLTDLGDIYSEKNGDVLRVSLGTFTGREAANKVLETVKKRGYSSAFPRKKENAKKNDK